MVVDRAPGQRCCDVVTATKLEALSSAVLIGAVLGLCGAAALVRPGRAGWGATRVPFGPSLALGIWGVRLGLGFAPT